MNLSPGKKVMAVHVSTETRKKVVQLDKFLTLSRSNGFWGKHQKLLGCNLLLVPGCINYTVLLAMGRTHRESLKHTLE